MLRRRTEKTACVGVFVGLLMLAPGLAAAETGCPAGAWPVASSDGLAPAQARKANRERIGAAVVVFEAPEIGSGPPPGHEARAARHQRNLFALASRMDALGAPDIEKAEVRPAQEVRHGRRSGGAGASILC